MEHTELSRQTPDTSVQFTQVCGRFSSRYYQTDTDFTLAVNIGIETGGKNGVITNIRYHGKTPKEMPELQNISTIEELRVFCLDNRYREQETAGHAAPETKNTTALYLSSMVTTNRKTREILAELESAGNKRVFLQPPRGLDLSSISALEIRIWGKTPTDHENTVISAALMKGTPVTITRWPGTISMADTAKILQKHFYGNTKTDDIESMLKSWCALDKIPTFHMSMPFETFRNILEKCAAEGPCLGGVDTERAVQEVLARDGTKKFIGDMNGNTGRKKFTEYFIRKQLDACKKNLFTEQDINSAAELFLEYAASRPVITVDTDRGLRLNSLCPERNEFLSWPIKSSVITALIPDIMDILLLMPKPEGKVPNPTDNDEVTAYLKHCLRHAKDALEQAQLPIHGKDFP